MEEPEYRRLVDSLLRVTDGDNRVAALLVYGSRAGDAADRFSDLDVGLVTTDDAYDQVVASGRDLIGALGTPLFIEDFGEPARLHAILADGADMELIIDRESDLELAEPFRVLATALAAKHGLPYPAELDRLLSDRLRDLSADRPPA